MKRETRKALKQLSKTELLALQYEIENKIRIKRIRTVLATIARQKKRPARVNFLEQQLARELQFSMPRAVFIDDILEQLEVLLDLD